MTEKDPRSFLPLTPLAFQALLALADGERHGYGIIREVDERTDGLIKLRTGTLYTLLLSMNGAQVVAVSVTRVRPEPCSGCWGRSAGSSTSRSRGRVASC